MHSCVRGDIRNPAASCVPSSTGPGANVEPIWPYVGPAFPNNVQILASVRPPSGPTFYVIVSVPVKRHCTLKTRDTVLYRVPFFFSLASPYSCSVGSTWPKMYDQYISTSGIDPVFSYCWVGSLEKRQNALKTHSPAVCHASFLGVPMLKIVVGN